MHRRRRKRSACVMAVGVFMAHRALGQVVDKKELCASIKTCSTIGGTDCDRTTTACPPCIYQLNEQYSCWQKSSDTNQCAFTGVLADCSSEWETTAANGLANGSASAPTDESNSKSTPATGFGSKEVLIAAGAIALVIVLVIVIAVFRRNKAKKQQQDPFFMMEAADPVKKNHPKNRKQSEPAILESTSASDGAAFFSMADDGIDGILGASPDPLPYMAKQTQHQHHATDLTSSTSSTSSSSSGSSRHKKKDALKDISLRVTTSANMFDEYLKMKHEMQYDSDALSDVNSDTYGSVGPPSVLLVARTNNRTLSMTDSEYLAAQTRLSRGESDCYSEMSYNDEKYSFSEDDQETIKGLDREVEI